MKYIALVYLFFCISVFSAESLTDSKVSLFGYDDKGDIKLLVLPWGTNCGFFVLSPVGDARLQGFTSIQDYDFWFRRSTNEVENVTTNIIEGEGYTNVYVNTNMVYSEDIILK